MKALVMDTAGEALVVVLIDGNEVHVATDFAKNGHSMTLLKAVDELTKKAGIALANIDYFAANVGPGSFTGIRIGVCTANAFSYVYNKPVLPLNTFMVHRTGTETLVLDAKHGNGYFEMGDGTQGFAEKAVLGQFVEIAGIPDGSAYKSAVEKMIKNGLATDQLVPLYLKASEAECKELK